MRDNSPNSYKILVSVIMCVYNTPKCFLFEAVSSILNQTYTNFELIIVDDCSRDSFYEDEIFGDKRIVLLKNEVNSGAAVSRNKALAIAKGKYIAIMDSDDISLPKRLEKQVEFMESNPDVVVCGTWFKFIGDKNHEVKRVVDDNDYYRCCLLFGNSPTILNPSVMIRRQTLVKNNVTYHNELRYGQDYGMWVDISKYGRITNLKEVLVHYRLHESQVTYLNNIKRQTSKYDYITKKRMIVELGLKLNDDEMELFSNFYHSKKWNANLYIGILKKIVEANKLTNIYVQEKLERRVHEQWISAVQNVKSPIKIISLIVSQKKHRREILQIKIKQLF